MQHYFAEGKKQLVHSEVCNALVGIRCSGDEAALKGIKAMMKAWVLFFFVVVSGSVIPAQQVAEWRPNIADDNKAATLDDTMKFVVANANDSNRVYRPSEKQNGALFFETFGASSSKCSMEWSSIQGWIANGHIEYLNRWKQVADLSKIDPLTITVTPVLMGDFPYGFRIAMQGTSQVAFNDAMGYFRADDHIRGEIWAYISQEESATCALGDKKCSNTQRKDSHAEMFITNQEAAHRTARALLHAALLCGGIKAVSPF
jgi:hypothetical protein